MLFANMTGPELAAEYNKMAKLLGRPVIKKFRTLAVGVAKCKELAALTTRKNSRHRFGSNVLILLAKEDNPRRTGTRAHQVYAKMMAYVQKQGGRARLSDVCQETGYSRPDFDWDLERGNIRKEVT